MKKIKLNGQIGAEITAESISELLAQSSGDITIELHSGGGSIVEGFAVHNAIEAYEGNVDFILTGLAASMGSYIPMAGNKVSVYENTVFMIHNGHTMEWGDHHALRKTANIIEPLSNILAKKYADKTGKLLEEIYKMMNEETYLYGQEIVDAGFADTLIKKDTKDKKTKAEAILLAKASIRECQGACDKDSKGIEAMLASMPSVIADSEEIPSELLNRLNGVSKRIKERK